MTSKKTVTAVIAVLVALACCAGFAAPAAADSTDNFVIIYIAAGDLASVTLGDMTAFLQGWNPDNGTLLMFYGATEAFGDNNDSGTFEKQYDGIGNGMLIFDYEHLKRVIANSDTFLGVDANGKLTTDVLGTINTKMLTRAGLTEAIQYANTYAMENGLSNANRYIIFDDHGGGYSGFGWDYSGNDSKTHLSNADIAYGLSQSDKKFELIIFDACLMANLDTAYALKDTADYLLASQEVTYGYEEIYPILAGNFGMDTVSFGKLVIDAYKKSEDNASGKTLALIDLSKIDGLVSAVDAAGTVLTSKLDDTNYFSMLGYLYARDSQNGGVMKYGAEPEDGDYLGFGFDLYSFMELISQKNTNESVKAAAENVMNEIKNNVVLAEYHSSKKNPSNGISIASSLAFEQNEIDASVTLSDGGWADFIRAFAKKYSVYGSKYTAGNVTVSNTDSDDDEEEYYDDEHEDDEYYDDDEYEYEYEYSPAATASARSVRSATVATVADQYFDAVSLTFLYTVNGKDIIVGDDPAKVEMTDGGDSDWIQVPSGKYESEMEWDGIWYALVKEDGTVVPVSLTYEYGFWTDDGRDISVYTMEGCLYRMIDGEEVGHISEIDVLTDTETGEVLDLELCSETYAKNSWDSTEVLPGDRFVPVLMIYNEKDDSVTESASEQSFVFSSTPVNDVRRVQFNPDDCSYLIEVDCLMDEGNASYVDPENPSAAQSPAPVLGVLLGLAAAGVLLASRRH